MAFGFRHEKRQWGIATKNVYRIVDSGSKGPESCENPPLWAAEQTVA